MKHFQSFSYTFCCMHVYKGRTEHNLLIQDAQTLVGRMWREKKSQEGLCGSLWLKTGPVCCFRVERGAGG